MLWIGLTGGIACGKSTVSKLLAAKGFPVVDADVLAREVVRIGEPALEEIEAAFGPGLVDQGRALDRQKLASIVFIDPKKLAQLETILHPRIRNRALERKRALTKAGTKVAFYDVALLFEKHMQTLFDETVVVTCSADRQLERLILRNSLTGEEATRRIAAQLSLGEKERLAGDVIRNDGDFAALELEVSRYLKRLFQRFPAAS